MAAAVTLRQSGDWTAECEKRARNQYSEQSVFHLNCLLNYAHPKGTPSAKSNLLSTSDLSARYFSRTLLKPPAWLWSTILLVRLSIYNSPMRCPFCRSRYLVIRQRSGWEWFMLHFTDKRKYRCMGCGHSFRAIDRRSVKRPPVEPKAKSKAASGQA